MSPPVVLGRPVTCLDAERAWWHRIHLEADLHLLTRRIKVDELLNDSVGWHRRRLVNA